MISKATIDKVYEAIQVEDVIGDYVTLKKSGSNYKGLSPFVEEKTPSFMVSPAKGIWKDFSSGKGGNSIAFLMELEHYTYPEAIRFLAKKYNIEIEETEQTDEQKQQADERESMYIVNDFAQKYFQKTLKEHPKGKAVGLSYFKERGFTDETIEKFQLGYCLDEWSGFTDEALNKGYNIKYLEATGLTIVKEGGKQFDRFKGRVLFPIHSMSGRVLGFGGRILTNDKKAAKYLNSPESAIYHKSKVLYGIHQAKQSISKNDACYLVEGYTDVISFAQKGIHNVVASSGTALTPDQIRLVKRLTNNMVVLFDGDAAGLRAALRGVDLILEQGMNVKVVQFPEGEDPDSFAKQNSLEDLQDFLENTQQDFIRFKVSILLKESQNDPIKKAEVIREIVQSIAKIPDGIKREVYIQECSRLLEISEKILYNELAQILNKNVQEAEKKRVQEQKKNTFQVSTQNQSSSGSFPPGMDGPPPDFFDEGLIENQANQTNTASSIVQKETQKLNDVLEIFELEIIKILLLYGNHSVVFKNWVEEYDKHGHVVEVEEKYEALISEEIFLQLQEDEIELANPLFKEVYEELVHIVNQNEKITLDLLTAHTNPAIVNLVTDILMDEERYQMSDWESQQIEITHKEDKLDKLVTDVLLNIRRWMIDKKINELSKESSNPETANESLSLIMDYMSLRKKIAEKLYRVV